VRWEGGRADEGWGIGRVWGEWAKEGGREGELKWESVGVDDLGGGLGEGRHDKGCIHVALV
jgi:hypothetical protein